VSSNFPKKKCFIFHENDAAAPTSGLFGKISGYFSTPAAPETKGVYLYGGVGTGKTMLMDLMIETVQEHGPSLSDRLGLRTLKGIGGGFLVRRYLLTLQRLR
jgi:DNA replication protein DnaC